MTREKSRVLQMGQQPTTLAIRPKKVYSREFKFETLRLLTSGARTNGGIEWEHGLYPAQVRLWERAFHKR